MPFWFPLTLPLGCFGALWTNWRLHTNIFNCCNFQISRRWVCSRSTYLCSLRAFTLSWLCFAFLFPPELISMSHKITFLLMLCKIEFMSKLYNIIIVRTASYISRCLIIATIELWSSIVNPMPSFLHRTYPSLNQATVAFLTILTDLVPKCITLLVGTQP